MIWDCFLFCDEWDVLELRLRTMRGSQPSGVMHVLVEADRTFAGESKPLHFKREGRERLPDFADLVVVVECNLPSCADGNRWGLEALQRNSMLLGLKGADARRDAMMVSDVDEIPDMGSWSGEEGVLVGPAYYYRLNRLLPDEPWSGPVVLWLNRYAAIAGRVTPQDARNFRSLLRPVGKAWHFGWTDCPKRKVKRFSHSELDVEGFDPDPYRHPATQQRLVTVPIDDGFPAPLRDDPERFEHMVDPCCAEAVAVVDS